MPVAAQGVAHAAGHFAKCFLTVQPQPVLAGRLASSEMRTSAPDLRLSRPVCALRSAVGRGLLGWPIAEVSPCAGAGAAFPPLPSQSASRRGRAGQQPACWLRRARREPSRCPHRVLPPRARGSTSWMRKYAKLYFPWFSFVDRSVDVVCAIPSPVCTPYFLTVPRYSKVPVL